MLTRTGLVLRDSAEMKRELTVRPIENGLGYPQPSFRVYRADGKGNLCVPRYYGIAVQKDTRPEPEKASIQFQGRLRDFQETALTKYLETNSGGVISIYCGGGKTTVGLAIASRLKLRTMILVHKEFLANQWRERINQFCPGASIGLVQGESCDLTKDFVIAMIQTLCTRSHPIGTFDSIGLLIVDEAHHIGAPAFSQVMFKMCPKWTLGLTATPERKDGLTRLLYWFLGPEVFRLERTEQKQVVVKKVTYTWKEKENPILVHMITKLTEDDSRNHVISDILYECRSHGRKVLLLTDRRRHCFDLKNWISGASLYIGGMSEAELTESAKSDVILATYSLAHEGLDIPDLDTVVLATPKSDVKQAVGRIMRGAESPVIYDIVDTWGSLHGMWRKRRAMYQQSGFTIENQENECLFQAIKN